MSALYVTVVLDALDGAGNPIGLGYANLAPSVTLTDAADQMWVPPAPVQAPFSAAASPQVRILAIDNTGPQPPGWAWTISFPSVPGHPASFNIQPAAGPANFTATSASPCVFTWTATTYLTSLPNGTGVQLAGGSLPGGFVAGTTYYVTGSSGTTFQLAAASGGTALGSTSAGSGTLTVTQYHLSALSPVSSVTTMAAYAPLNSPALTGSPTAPTQTAGDASTKIATDAFVAAAASAATAYFTRVSAV